MTLIHAEIKQQPELLGFLPVEVAVVCIAIGMMMATLCWTVAALFGVYCGFIALGFLCFMVPFATLLAAQWVRNRTCYMGTIIIQIIFILLTVVALITCIVIRFKDPESANEGGVVTTQIAKRQGQLDTEHTGITSWIAFLFIFLLLECGAVYVSCQAYQFLSSQKADELATLPEEAI